MADRVRVKGGFATIPNSLARNPSLSLEARGMLVLIASHSDGWDFKQADMMKKSACGEAKYYRVIGELKSAGYLQVVPRDKANGRFSGSDWTVSFEPHLDKPGAGNQGSPYPENPDAENQGDKNTNIRIPKEETPLPPQGGRRAYGVPSGVLKILGEGE